jgi:biopolymer transport protein ExbD
MPVKLGKVKVLSLLSLTPLIDVVFLLLIFFLVATKFAEEDRLKQMHVDLPSASEARPLTQRSDDIQITVSAAGGFFIGPTEMTELELDEYLRGKATNNPVGQTAIIQADRRADWEFVAIALNACQKHGIKPTPRMKDFVAEQ